MRILLVHQNFPGQFREIAPALCDLGHELKAISCCDRISDPRIEVLRYQYSNSGRQGIHNLTGEVDEWISRAELAAKHAYALKLGGWAPDVILAHPGWGEGLLLKEVFPSTPLVVWPELWLRPEHLGFNRVGASIEQLHYLRIKNWLVDGAMADANLAILPTRYQAESFPEHWQSKIRVIPEGVPENLFEQQRLQSLTISPSATLGPEKQVVTFISRNLEPMRGFPEIMRALPDLQRRLPQLEVIIAGGDGVSYSSRPCSQKTWKEELLDELGSSVNLNRVHFVGKIPHPELVKLYRRSDLHVYLSHAFVLSWSLLEAMATGARLLIADNPMLKEIHEKNDSVYSWNSKNESLSEAIHRAICTKPATEKKRHETLRVTYGLNTTIKSLEAILKELSDSTF